MIDVFAGAILRRVGATKGVRTPDHETPGRPRSPGRAAPALGESPLRARMPPPLVRPSARAGRDRPASSHDALLTLFADLTWRLVRPGEIQEDDDEYRENPTHAL